MDPYVAAFIELVESSVDLHNAASHKQLLQPSIFNDAAAWSSTKLWTCEQYPCKSDSRAYHFSVTTPMEVSNPCLPVQPVP